MNLFLMSCTFYILFNKFLPTLMSQHPLLYLLLKSLKFSFLHVYFFVIGMWLLHTAWDGTQGTSCQMFCGPALLRRTGHSSPSRSPEAVIFYQNWQNRGAWFWTLNTVPSTIRLSTYQCYSLVIIIIL